MTQEGFEPSSIRITRILLGDTAWNAILANRMMITKCNQRLKLIGTEVPDERSAIELPGRRGEGRYRD